VLFLAIFLSSSGNLRAQTVVRSFDGDSGPGLAACESGITHCDRPDMNVAASGKQIVQVTWQNVRVYDYSGKLLRAIPTKTFVRDAGLDPQPMPPNAFQGPAVVAAGTQPWTYMNRGNLAEMANPAGIDTTLDPADGTKLWTTHRWSNTAERCVWNTRIVEYQVVGRPKNR
jgi:hypothetical protein